MAGVDGNTSTEGSSLNTKSTKDAGNPSNNPFPADNPTSVLFTPFLTSDNYCTWVRGMTKALCAKAKLGFIDGSIKKPTSTSEIPAWQRCDDLVESWISNSVDPQIQSSIMYFESSRDMWLDLKHLFAHSNTSKLYALK